MIRSDYDGDAGHVFRVDAKTLLDRLSTTLFSPHIGLEFLGI